MEEALRIRDAERRTHHDATHHVFACRIDGGTIRFDDDGEPAGTGGRPVLAAIDAAGLLRAVVVVTRWFGGTELGTGGLARAYRAAAAAALQELAVRRVRPGRRVTVTYPYELTGAVMRTVEAAAGRRLDESFGEGACLDVAVPAADMDRFLDRLADATAGRAEARVRPGEVLVPADRA